MGGNEGFNISGIKDKRLARLADKYDVGGTKGVLEANEFINFRNAMSETELCQLAEVLIEQNTQKLDSKSFKENFGLSKAEVQKYVNDNSKNKKILTRVINSFMKATPKEIAQNIEEIASDKFGAADDVAFKLWIAKIDKTNAFSVFRSYQNEFGDNTPFNAIIEERKTSSETRKKQILYVLSAIEGALGKNRANYGLIEDFKEQLNQTINSWGPSSASLLNTLYGKILAGLPNKDETFEGANTQLTVQNVRPEVKTLSLGTKYGKFSWQYTGIKNIKSLSDVSKLTGLSVDYLKNLIESEGNRPSSYVCPSGDRTIGIGHNFEHATEVDKNYLKETTLTQRERYQILAFDLVSAIQRLQSKGIDTTKLTHGQYEALVDVSFNAPAHMKSLVEKTNEAIALTTKAPNRAKQLFDEAAYEFNQQFASGKIAPGLCKRRIENIMRFMNISKYSDLPDGSQAKTRLEILALNGYKQSPFYADGAFRNKICNILGITISDFNKFKYPPDYKAPI